MTLETNYKDDYELVNAFATKATRIEFWYSKTNNEERFVIRKVDLSKLGLTSILAVSPSFDNAKESFYNIKFMLRDNGVEIEHWW